jgi:hypothetical protein
MSPEQVGLDMRTARARSFCTRRWRLSACCASSLGLWRATCRELVDLDVDLHAIV